MRFCKFSLDLFELDFFVGIGFFAAGQLLIQFLHFLLKSFDYLFLFFLLFRKLNPLLMKFNCLELGFFSVVVELIDSVLLLFYELLFVLQVLFFI